jgi:hypothetical protein
MVALCISARNVPRCSGTKSDARDQVWPKAVLLCSLAVVLGEKYHCLSLMSEEIRHGNCPIAYFRGLLH